jgi:hypothetical protein
VFIHVVYKNKNRCSQCRKHQSMRVFQHSQDLCRLSLILWLAGLVPAPRFSFSLRHGTTLCILCRNIHTCFFFTYQTRTHIQKDSYSSITFLYKGSFSLPLRSVLFPLIFKETVLIFVHVLDNLGLIWSLVPDGRFIYIPKSTSAGSVNMFFCNRGVQSAEYGKQRNVIV